MELCQPAMSAATSATAAAGSLPEEQSPSSTHKVLLHHQQHQVLFPTPKQSHRQQEDQHHRSSAFTGVERKSDHIEVPSTHSSSLTPVHAADYNELRGKYGYFPPSMFRDFMHDARARTFNTLYGSIDSKGMFHPANHLAHKQSSSSLPMGSAPGPGSQSHHNPFHSPAGSPAESLSQGSSHSLPSQYFDGSKMTDSGTYTPSYHTAGSGGESTLGSSSGRERKNRLIEIGETLSSASNRQGEGNQRSLGLLSHLMHHPHGFIPPQMMLMPPMHHFGHEMMPFMPPLHAPFHSLLPLHQLDHMYPYGRPFMPYMSPMMGYDAIGMMPPAYPGMGIGYPGMYHRSNGDGIDAVSPAPSGSHASRIHLSGGIYPPSRHPHHHPRPVTVPRHMHAPYQPPHLSPHHQHLVPVQPFPLPSHSPPSPTRTLFPYSFQTTPSSAPESRPDLASSSSSHKHDKHTAWMDEDEERGGSSPILPSRPRSASEVREAYEKAMIHNASKLTASPFFPYKRREDEKS